MRLQVSVHETPSTNDTLMNVLSAILSMAPVADAPSSRAGSTRTTASPVAPSAGTKVARNPRAGRTATSTNAIAAMSIRYSGLCVRHTHRTQTNIPTRRTGAETQERAWSTIDRLVRASTQANPLKQARQVQDILLHHTMPSPRGLVSFLGRKPVRQLGHCHEHRFP